MHSLVALYLTPAKICALKGIFDFICQEAAIPVNAKAERDRLARVIVRASYTTNSDVVVIDLARRAVRMKLSA